MYNKSALIVLCFCIFVNAYSMTFLFSFVGLYVVEINLASDRNEAGYYAGYIMSAFMLGRMFSAVYWGWFADRFGRRPVILIGLVSITTLSAPFGITTSLFGALASRFGAGFMNGIIATAKTMTSEMCSDEDAAFCMGLITGMWSLGLITGPAVSGWLSYPALNFPSWFSVDGMFGKYPFLLPCVVASLLGVLGLLLGFWGLNETLKSVASLCWFKSSQTRNSKVAYHPLTTDEQVSDKSVDGLEANTENEEIENEFILGSPTNDESIDVNTLVEEDGGTTEQPVLREILSKNVIIAVSIYSLFSFYSIFMNEIVPLWALASKSTGGLEMHVDQIGTILAVGGMCILVYQFTIYPLLSNRFSMKSQFVTGCLVTGTCAGLLPYLVTDASSGTSFWVKFILVNGTRRAAQVTTFTACGVMCNNACVQKHRGKINGLTMGCASFFKMLGPTVGSLLFAWSIQGTDSANNMNDQINKGTQLVDVHFSFLFAMCISVGLGLLGTQLPKELNHKVDEGEAHEIELQSK